MTTAASFSLEDSEFLTSVVTHSGNSPATYGQEVAITVTMAILAVWSIFGNLLTILAISLHKHMKTKFNLFIMSLAVSDLLSELIASPLWVYRRTWGFYNWEAGEFLCKFYWSLDETTNYCTALHIASLALLRLIGVKWPTKLEKITKRQITLYLVLLWLISLTFGGIIYSFYFAVETKGMQHEVYSDWPHCSIRISDNGILKHRAYYTVSSSLFLIFPMFVLITASALLVKEIAFKHDDMKSERRKEKEKRALFQLGLIATSFLIGYIPMTTYIMWTTRTTQKDLLVDYWFNVAAYLSLRLSECCNPVVYNIASEKMRVASQNILEKACCCCGWNCCCQSLTGIKATKTTNKQVRTV